jgi:hypothetical protein
MNNFRIGILLSSLNLILVFSPVFSLLSGVSAVFPRPVVFFEMLSAILVSAHLSMISNIAFPQKVAWPFVLSILVWGFVGVAWEIPRMFLFVEIVRIDVQRIILFVLPFLLASEYLLVDKGLLGARQTAPGHQQMKVSSLNGVLVTCMGLGVGVYFIKNALTIESFQAGLRMLVLFLGLFFPAYLLGLGAVSNVGLGNSGLVRDYRSVLYLVGVCGLCLIMTSL